MTSKPKKPALPSLEAVVSEWLDDVLELGSVHLKHLGWVRLESLSIGDELVSPRGVDIVFDGRGENEDLEEDEQEYSFAIYIGEKSLTEDVSRGNAACVWGWVTPDGEVSFVNGYEAIVNDSDLPEGAYETYEAVVRAIWQRDNPGCDWKASKRAR